MTLSLWRYSHLTLAISSAFFIFIASLTGIILAFEPISNKLNPYAIEGAKNITVAETIENLKAKYNEVIHVEIDKNSFVIASIITKKGAQETFYINPFTGNKIGDIIEKAPVFNLATKLHRSLFLKTTGRIIVGIIAFLLFLIAITGSFLISKQQGGFRYFFSNIEKNNRKQYYHTLLGKYALVPIIIITISGIYLSLEKLSILPSEKKEFVQPKKTIDNIQKSNLFKTTTLKDVKRIEFPFSDAPEDYYFLKLTNKELFLNQYNGNIINEKRTGIGTFLSNWNLFLHTGQGSIIWSIILLLTCICILFFIYSGFAMTLNRRGNRIKNKFKKDHAEYIILVGSENGSTFKFAKVLYDALITKGKTVFIAELNDYSSYKKAKHLVVLTATYGDGEAPSNATKFVQQINHITQQNKIQYSVVGFGSLSYNGFCNYAIIVDSLLQSHPNFTPNLLLHKINNQSFDAFKNWIDLWSNSKNITLQIKTPPKINQPKKLDQFEVIYTSELNTDDTFLIELKPTNKTTFSSGDLLAIYPENEKQERLYSIGKTTKGNILLSVKKHPFGRCSSYLNQLSKNDILSASIKQNKIFHFPTSTDEVILIANGTGIAPFLGMIHEKKHTNKKVHLFWGGRTKSSYKIYSSYVDSAITKENISTISLSFSKEEKEKKYVQNAITENKDIIYRTLKNKGTIMICGSIAMQKDVLKTLQKISISELNTPLNMHQIKIDCY